ncbi:SSU ribosomal protein S2p (SAe) [Candidatus Nasuia deltocephalinicola]|uniref:Small ribosomal subunit protein uS2 n=1 Tax=Candidatus Nasuia deltocephalincola TaxID=1160784 RepID=A0A0S2UPC6_9PROT|nr:SSU ribosomal protein S2p (SAe) [Candidatus Nasuia deltocephalinicola]
MNKKLIINEMLSNNIHLGHKKNLLNKSMELYILNLNDKIHIINLEITLRSLIKIKKLMGNLKKLNKKILIVCVEKNTREFVKKYSKKVNMPYVNKRWLGGGLTNFKTLKGSIDNMNYIKIILKDNKFKIKKKRKRILKKKLKKLKSFLNGLKNLKNLPDYIFVINVKKNKNLIKESKKMKIPSIAVVDTNDSTKNIDYLIPGNDDSFKSIIFYIKKITSYIK